MTPALADIQFLENAKKLSMYGVDLHHAKVWRNKCHLLFLLSSCYVLSLLRFSSISYLFSFFFALSIYVLLSSPIFSSWYPLTFLLFLSFPLHLPFLFFPPSPLLPLLSSSFSLLLSPLIFPHHLLLSSSSHLFYLLLCLFLFSHSSSPLLVLSSPLHCC